MQLVGLIVLSIKKAVRLGYVGPLVILASVSKVRDLAQTHQAAFSPHSLAQFLKVIFLRISYMSPASIAFLYIS